MNKRHRRWIVVTLCLAFAAPVFAQNRPTLPQPPRGTAKPPPRMAANDFWVSIGGGAYTGKNYEAPPNAQNPESYEVGGYSGHLSFNFIGGGAMLRLRSSWLTEYTSNTAEEVGALLGLALTPDRKAYIAVGASRLTDVSDTQQSPTVGVPVDLVFYPSRGLELMIHGNFNDDSNFVGFGISGVIGKDRGR